MKILRNMILFLLFVILGFFIGVQYAIIIEAGKGQMLAGGAIVLGHGVVGAVLGLMVSIFVAIANKSKPQIIIQLNKILSVLVISFILFFWFNYQRREEQKNEELGYEMNSTIDSKNTLSKLIYK